MNKMREPLLRATTEHANLDRKEIYGIVTLYTPVWRNKCYKHTRCFIDELVERGEKLDLLVDKTENLTAAAVTFKTAGRNLHNQMW